MASSATRHFVMQRMTALIQVPLVIWLVISIVRHGGDTHAEFMTWISRPLTAGLMALFILSVFFHMRLGMMEVIEDYLHKKSGRSLAAAANTFFALILGTIALIALIALTLIA